MFLTPKMAVKLCQLGNSVDFWFHFCSTSTNFALFAPKKFIKLFPLIAEDIKKEEKKHYFTEKISEVNTSIHTPK